jgi:hypothetical protein
VPGLLCRYQIGCRARSPIQSGLSRGLSAAFGLFLHKLVAHNRPVAPWRTIRARDRREPAGFIRPCQPVLVHQIPTGSEWIHELKWDGYRLIARCENGVVYLWSRTGVWGSRCFQTHR